MPKVNEGTESPSLPCTSVAKGGAGAIRDLVKPQFLLLRLFRRRPVSEVSFAYWAHSLVESGSVVLGPQAARGVVVGASLFFSVLFFSCLFEWTANK